MTSIRQATVIWLLLIVATMIASLIGEMSYTGMWVTSCSVAILVIKGQLIVDHFMALKEVNHLWRLLLSAYCLVIGLLVLLAYYLGLS